MKNWKERTDKVWAINAKERKRDGQKITCR